MYLIYTKIILVDIPYNHLNQSFFFFLIKKGQHVPITIKKKHISIKIDIKDPTILIRLSNVLNKLFPILKTAKFCQKYAKVSTLSLFFI